MDAAETHANAGEHERAERFLTYLVNAHRAYHDHKETMAYAGTTLFVAAFGAALLSEYWPPNWLFGDLLWRRVFTSGAITIVLYLALKFVRWQLGKRRWAAIHVAGTERVLARWVAQPPSEEDLIPWQPFHKSNQPAYCPRLQRFCSSLKDLFWPSEALNVESDVSNECYPKAVVDEWIEQEKDPGTDALNNERLLVVTIWIFYGALLGRTIFN